MFENVSQNSDTEKEEQPLTGVLQQKNYFGKFCQIHRKTLGIEPFFSKVVGLACDCKKYKCFLSPVPCLFCPFLSFKSEFYSVSFRFEEHS